LPDTLLRSLDDVRNSLIVEGASCTLQCVSFFSHVPSTHACPVDKLSSDGITELQILSDVALSEAAVAGQVLLRSGLRNASALSTMSLEDQRNTLITANVAQFQEPVSYFQSLSTMENCRLGYAWYSF
jgi:hypothetical protein